MKKTFKYLDKPLLIVTIILFLIGALIIITAVVIILIVVLKDDDDDKGKDNDDKEEEEPKEEEKEEEPKEEEKEEEEEVEKPYDYGLDLEELIRITNPENLNTFVLLKPTSEEYLNLKEGDREALKYLVKAGAILENIQLRIDEHNNIPFKKFLEDEIKKGVEKANLTKIVFDGQKGINAMDALSNKIYLAKGITQKTRIRSISWRYNKRRITYNVN